MTVRGVLLVRSEGRRLGIPLAEVIEVSEMPAVKPVPGAHPALCGVASARGRLVPCFHLGALLAGRSCPPGCLVAQTLVLAVAGSQWVGLQVDDADAAPNESMLPHPLGRRAEEWTLGALRRPEGWIAVLNLGTLAERWLSPERPT
jgi:chemotaxis signal transduction protein